MSKVLTSKDLVKMNYQLNNVINYLITKQDYRPDIEQYIKSGLIFFKVS